MEAVIFDCDGTLLDSIGAWHEAEEALLADAGLTLSAQDRDKLNTLTLEEAGEFFYEEYGVLERPEQLRDNIENYLLDFYRYKAKPVPGAQRFVAELRNANIPLAVLSSSPHSLLEPGLRSNDFSDAFQEVVSVDDIPWSKRDSEAFFHVCELLNSAPEQTWYFDDSYFALQAACEAGLQTVGVFSSDNCGTHEQLARFSEFVIDDFSNETLSKYLTF